MVLLQQLRRSILFWLMPWELFRLTPLIFAHASPFESIHELPEELKTLFLQDSSVAAVAESGDRTSYCQLLLRFLKREGFHSVSLQQEYYDAQSQSWQPLKNNSYKLQQDIKIRLQVSLGLSTDVSQIWIIPEASELDPELTHFLHNLVARTLHQPASYRNYVNFQAEILKAFSDFGYLTAQCRTKKLYIYPSTLQADGKQASWIFIISPGLRARFGQVNYSNFRVTKGHLETLATFQPGEPYLATKKEAFRTALLQTGWFEEVRLLSTPDFKDPTLQNLQVLGIPRSSKPFSIHGSLSTVGLTILADLKCPIINKYGHQVEVSVGYKNILIPKKIAWSPWRWPNSFSLTYTVPRFKLPFISQIERFDLLFETSQMRRILYGCKIEAAQAWSDFEILENYTHLNGTLGKGVALFIPQIEGCKSSLESLSTASEDQRIELNGRISGYWGNLAIGRSFFSKKSWLQKSELKGLIFLGPFAGNSEASKILGAWMCATAWMHFHQIGSLNCPLEFAMRAQSLVVRDFARDFKNIPPKFRCFSGGDTFLIGRSLDSVAPIYADGSYGGRNGFDASFIIGKFSKKIARLPTTFSFFFSQAFFNCNFKQKPYFDAQLRTGGVRWLIGLGPTMKLAFYLGAILPNDLQWPKNFNSIWKAVSLQIRVES